MNEADTIKLFKCLADRSRLQILKSLAVEDMYTERLAERLGLTAPTVSFHMKKLEDAGAVTSRREQYYTVYSLKHDVLMTNILDIISERSDEEDEQAKREAEYRRKIIETFFEYGRLKTIPASRKKERVCLEKIAESFEVGKAYDEREVNEIILTFNEDYCTIRRDMIGEGIMERTGTVYVRKV